MLLDTVYTVETPEGIAITLRAAGPVARALAYFLDLLIRGVALFVVGFIASWADALGTAVMLIAYFLVEWIYPVAFELSGWGATPGKRALGLQVMMDSGLPVTPAASLLRNLLRVVDFLPMFYTAGLASMLVRPDFKRWGDIAAGTLVVHTRSVVLHAASQPADPLAPVKPLSLSQQTAIVAWAERFATLTPARLDELADMVVDVAPAVDASGKRLTSSQRVLGVARWLMGYRVAAASRGAP